MTSNRTNSLTSYGSFTTPLTSSTTPNPVVNGSESWKSLNSILSNQSLSSSSESYPILSTSLILIPSRTLKASPVKLPSLLNTTPHPRELYPNLQHPLQNTSPTRITPTEWIVMGFCTSSHMRLVATSVLRIKNEVRDLMAKPGVMLWTGYTFSLALSLSHRLHEAGLMSHFLSHVSLLFPWGFASFPLSLTYLCIMFPYLWLDSASFPFLSLDNNYTWTSFWVYKPTSSVQWFLSMFLPLVESIQVFTQNLQNSLNTLKLVNLVKACLYTCLNN